MNPCVPAPRYSLHLLPCDPAYPDTSTQKTTHTRNATQMRTLLQYIGAAQAGALDEGGLSFFRRRRCIKTVPPRPLAPTCAPPRKRPRRSRGAPASSWRSGSASRRWSGSRSCTKHGAARSMPLVGMPCTLWYALSNAHHTTSHAV